MSDSSSEGYGRRAGINEPAMRVALVLSLLVHAAALWRVPMDFRPLSFEEDEHKPGRLTVRLAPPPAPPAAPSMPSTPSTPARERPTHAAAQPAHRAAPPPRQEQPVIAMAKPAPDVPAPRQQPPAPPAQPAPRAPAGDLSSYIEARRRARGEQSPPSVAAAESRPAAPAAEDENTRANRIAAANVGADRTPTFGSDRLRSGGVFHIQRVSLDYAEFLFYGWNKDIRRNTSQLIEVRRGNAPDIRIAVVRRMIGIIRDYETEDFVWESERLGRYLTLSARLKDNAGLEEFMMREFFENYRGP